MCAVGGKYWIARWAAVEVRSSDRPGGVDLDFSIAAHKQDNGEVGLDSAEGEGEEAEY